MSNFWGAYQSGGLFLGLPERILNPAHAGVGGKHPRVSVNLGVHMVLPRRFSSSQIGQQKSPAMQGFSVGLPERIRTFDLQSRSLTRYPAVPRVDMKFLPYHYSISVKKKQPLFQKKWSRKAPFPRPFSAKNTPLQGLATPVENCPSSCGLFHNYPKKFPTACGKVCGHLGLFLEFSA